MFNGNYSWMLYGDDDTLFFIDSVSELLQDFDPSLPYIITGMGLPQRTLILQETLQSLQHGDHAVKQQAVLCWAYMFCRVLFRVVRIIMFDMYGLNVEYWWDVFEQQYLEECRGAE